MIQERVALGRTAQRAFATWSTVRVRALLADLAEDHAEHAATYGALTAEETRMGDAAHKAIKNVVASRGVWASMRDARVGLLSEEDGVMEVARPVGLVFAVVPITNPGPSLIHMTLSALMGQNAIVLSPHRATLRVAELFRSRVETVLSRHEAPAGLVQVLTHRGDRDETRAWMEAADLVVATGGAGLVRAAYRSGTPALGVGPGNAPCWIAEDAPVESLMPALVSSASFDHSLTCGSESHLVVARGRAREARAALRRSGARVLSPDEVDLARAALFEGGHLRPSLVGQSARAIAAAFGVTTDARLLVFPLDRVDATDPLCRESLAPLVTLRSADDDDDAIAICASLLAIDGAGHTAAIHTEDRARVARFAGAMPVARVFVNGPCAFGTVGVTSRLEPSFTVGSGTWGGCSTTDNVGWRHMVNVQRVVAPRPREACPAGSALPA